jgi:hypothetical protein
MSQATSGEKTRGSTPDWPAASQSAPYAVLPPWRLTSELQPLSSSSERCRPEEVSANQACMAEPLATRENQVIPTLFLMTSPSATSVTMIHRPNNWRYFRFVSGRRARPRFICQRFGPANGPSRPESWAEWPRGNELCRCERCGKAPVHLLTLPPCFADEARQLAPNARTPKLRASVPQLWRCQVCQRVNSAA